MKETAMTKTYQDDFTPEQIVEIERVTAMLGGDPRDHIRDPTVWRSARVIVQANPRIVPLLWMDFDEWKEKLADTHLTDTQAVGLDLRAVHAAALKIGGMF